MPSSIYDLSYLEACMDSLEAYLLASDLYWPTGASAPAGEPEFPSLTLGGLLLARERLVVRRLDAAQQAKFNELDQALNRTRTHWRVAWGRKALRGFDARLTQWRDYLSEYTTQPEAYAAQYPYEVRLRRMIDLLKPEAEGVDPAAVELLASLDTLLRARLKPSTFIWEADLERGYPHQSCWYLYGRLPGK